MKAVNHPFLKSRTDGLGTFWTLPPEAICVTLHCGLEGLSSDNAQRRPVQYGPNSDAETESDSVLRAILRRLLEPLSLILLAAGIVSVATGDAIGSIIVAILALSIGLDTVQEGHAVRAADILRRSVALKAEVKRDGAFHQIDVDCVVPGDILRVRAGDVIPADALILQSNACTAGEAALTGEPYPVEKRPGAIAAVTPGEASNALFRGAVAQTGEAIVLAVNTGPATVFGAAASALAQGAGSFAFSARLARIRPCDRATDPRPGGRCSGDAGLVGRPVLDSLLFAVALAVGLTPELLPMIRTVTLSRGALRMAARKVIVKRLAAIHDLGAMTVLCTDKTGTLTSAEITLARSLDPFGADNPRAAQLGAIAAGLGGIAARSTPRWFAVRSEHTLAQDGLRVVAVASRSGFEKTHEVEAADEKELVFEGICAFADPPKPTAAAAIARLASAGMRLKILSGDDPIVVKRLAGLVGLNAERILSGTDVAVLSDEALAVQVQSVDAYGRLAPDQKSRIVKALQAKGAIVGFLGDGINDAPALKIADIGLSVEGATGVAQAAADMILLASDLEVVADGVEEGRRTFANILKYVRMGASSNFGNMLSMAVASIALPFLPMLPTQILLNNLLYDLSELGIPFDGVRPEATARPQVWDMSGSSGSRQSWDRSRRCLTS
jgi:Mg2+-importing ATPase